MQTRVPERFVRVDISNPREEFLLEQEWFQIPASFVEQSNKILGGDFHRLGSELAYDARWIVYEPHPAEFAWIAKAEFASAVELKEDVHVWVARRCKRIDRKSAGHAKMNQQINFRFRAREVKDQEFSTSGDVENLVTADPGREFARAGLSDRPLPAYGCADDGRAAQLAAEIADRSFDLGEFRHGKTLEKIQK